MAKQSLSSRLKAAQKDWMDSEARRPGSSLPDGTYEGVIKNAEVGVSKGEKARMQCVWSLEVTAGKHEGSTTKKFSGLETRENMDWFKGDLEALDLTIPDDLKDIGETLEEAINLPILFRVRSRDEFTNIDFLERLEGVDSQEEEEEEEETEETEEEDVEWSKGDYCVAEIDGEEYTGTIKKVNDDGTATVKFEDGDVLDVDLDELMEAE